MRLPEVTHPLPAGPTPSISRPVSKHERRPAGPATAATGRPAGTTARGSPVPAAPATGGAATGCGEAAAGQRPPFGRMLIDAIVEGNSVVVTVLAIVAAIVVGGLLIAFTDPVVLSAW